MKKQELLQSPALKSVDLIRSDLDNLGFISQDTRCRIIDEEMTHAAEIVASITSCADIPRYYFVQGGDLVDTFGVSLNEVLAKGIDFLDKGTLLDAAGESELRRRKTEFKNLKQIIAMPEGYACIEISPTDLNLIEEDRAKYGYTGDTLVRITYKAHATNLIQRNVLLKTSELHSINKLRKLIDKHAVSVGCAEDALDKTQFVSIKSSELEDLVANISNFSQYELVKNQPLNYLLSALTKRRKSTLNAWGVVNSNRDIFDELIDKFETMSRGTETIDPRKVNSIRAGLWQVLCDQARAASESSKKNTLRIDDGIREAYIAGAVFTACGGSVSLRDNDSTNNYLGYFERYATVKALDKLCGHGKCLSCGLTGDIFGCGVYCRSCNEVWCREYLTTGKQLSNKEVSESRYLSIFRFWLS